MKIYKGNITAIITTAKDMAAEHKGIINYTCSTDGMPYRAINLVDDKPVGGQPMTSAQVKQIVDMSVKAGLKIEDVITID